MGSPGGSAGKESACNVGDLGSIPKENTEYVILLEMYHWNHKSDTWINDFWGTLSSASCIMFGAKKKGTVTSIDSNKRKFL